MSEVPCGWILREKVCSELVFSCLLETHRDERWSLRIRKSQHHSTYGSKLHNQSLDSSFPARWQRQRPVQDVQNVAKFTRPSLKIGQSYVPCLYIILTCTSRRNRRKALWLRHFGHFGHSRRSGALFDRSSSPSLMVALFWPGADRR